MVRYIKIKSKNVLLASDHAGFRLKEEIKKFLIKKKIKYSYFKGTDPSTWISNILKFNRFMNEKN